MPPLRSENIFKKPYEENFNHELTDKQREELFLQNFYIDINDPRNSEAIAIIREEKNEGLKRLLKEDLLNPLHEINPFRHQLLRAKLNNVDFADIEVPLLEKEIINNKDLIEKLELMYRQ